jgi:hypothetical protein
MLRKHIITFFFVFYFSVYSASIVTANSIEAEESDQQQATGNFFLIFSRNS